MISTYIKQDDLRSILNTSFSTVQNIKRKLGYKKGEQVKTSDIPKFKAAIKKIRKSKGGRNNKLYPEYYREALKIIETDGFITQEALKDIFCTSYIIHIEAFFESQGNPIYDELMPDNKKRNKSIKKRGIKIYKLLNPLYDKWKQETLHKPPKNGCVGSVGKNV